MAVIRRKASPKGRPVYIVEVKQGGRWKDCGEGPWGSSSAAARFAQAEVGLDWRVVAIHEPSAALRNRNR